MAMRQEDQPRLLEADGTVNFFGIRGRLDDNNKWLMSPGSGQAMVPTHPDSTYVFILSCVMTVATTSRASRIARVNIDPRRAVVLFMEGAITPEQIAKAHHGPNYINIPEVMVANRLLTVRIHANEIPRDVVTDAEGNRL